MIDSDFLWLLKWYESQCNDDWEHGYGIHIETIDNPGWSITINLEDTLLENKVFNKIKIDYSSDDWLYCIIKEKKFEGRCGAMNLPKVLGIFRRWAESNQ